MGKYVVKAGKTGYLFNLTAANGQVIGTSEIYTTKAACLTGADSVRRNAPEAGLEDQTQPDCESCKCPKFELYIGRDGQFRFRLRAKNGENILASEGYTRRESCLNGVDSVRKNADSPVEA